AAPAPALPPRAPAAAPAPRPPAACSGRARSWSAVAGCGDPRVVPYSSRPLLPRLDPRQVAAHALQQVGGGVRLGEEIGGPQSQAAHAIALLSLGGEQDHRDVGPARILLEGPADGEAVAPG